MRVSGLESIRVPVMSRMSVTYKRINMFTTDLQVEDDDKDNIYPYLDPIADKMHETIKNGGAVVVHCIAGVSRSSTLVIGETFVRLYY